MYPGKLLTTPSRLLKLILPLTTLDKNDDGKDIEPLALLVHPQQPLSYLERLIQSELPMIKSKDGKEKIPDVFFRAEDAAQDDEEIVADERDEDEIEEDEEGSDVQVVDGKKMKLGKIESGDKKTEKDMQAQQRKQDEKAAMRNKLRGGHGEGGVESYSGTGREGAEAGEGTKFVRKCS